MIFILGVSDKEEELNYSKQMICPNCKSYDRFQAYMNYMRLTIFFIPIIKWNRSYYLKSRCCSTIFEVSNEIGRDMERGHDPIINEEDLIVFRKGKAPDKICTNCGMKINSEFSYCPNCGNEIN